MKRNLVIILLFAVALFLCVSASAEPAVPTNASWKQGSSATAVWDSVAEANYYKVTVYVYNGSALLGSVETGTAGTELDVQQEIYEIVGNTELDSVYVRIKVASEIINGNDVQTSAYSQESPRWYYKLHATAQLPIPTNIVLYDNYTVLFDPVDHVSWYYYQVKISYGGEEYLSGTEAIYEYQMDGRNPVSIFNKIKSHYLYYGFTNEDVNVSFRVCSFSYFAENPEYRSSEYSEWTNPVKFQQDYVVKDLPIPTNVVLNDDYTVLFDPVDHVSWYYYQVKISYGSKEYLSGTEAIYTYQMDGRNPVSIFNKIKSHYLYYGFTNEDVNVSFRVCSFSYFAENPEYKSSEYSEWTNPIKFQQDYVVKDLPIPTNVVLNDDYTVLFDPVDHVSWYYYQVKISYGSKEYLSGTEAIYTYQMDGRNPVSIFSKIKSHYLYYSFTDEEVNVSFRVCSFSYFAENPEYRSSDYSDWTAPIKYSSAIKVKSIVLSPAAPILYLGHSLFLGKTITPENAHYESIEWLSQNESVLSVNQFGRVYAKAVGDTIVTATIDDVSSSIPVNVYTITSNIENQEDQNEVTETAGTIIDDIGNNDNPDLGNTDISASDIEDLQEQIHEGVERGDEFRTDIVLSKRDWAHFKKYWNEIQKYIENGNFACAYDINVEVYHQDGQGNKYHIANITQFGNEIGFTIEADSLPETAPGQLRDFKLIRIHDGVLEVLPVKANKDGSFSSESDKFSEFILMYEDKDETVNAGTENIDAENNGTDNTGSENANVHTHSLKKHEKIDSTCTATGTEAYWECTTCKELFSDESGKNRISAPVEIAIKDHVVVTDAGVAPTKDSSGLTEGKHCERCGKVLVKQEVLPDLVSAFVIRSYRIILSREPEMDGLKFWTDILKNGKMTAAEVINGFVNSVEFQNKNLNYADSVEVMYRVMLNRGSDADGKAYWVSILNGGNSLSAVISGFCQSDEFRRICAEYGITPGSLDVGELKPAKPMPVVDTAKVRAFVTRCYQLILSRQPEEDGLVFWTNLLATGEMTAAEVVNGFVNSVEFQNKNLSYDDSVEVMYRVMLDRGSDAGGKAYWVSILNGGNPLAAVISGFCQSDEFRGICAKYGITSGSLDVGELKPAKPVPVVDMEKIHAFVTRCYRIILSREPEADGLEFWSDRLATGASTAAEIIDGFVNSDEFMDHQYTDEEAVEILYKTMLNRSSDAEGKAHWLAILAEGEPFEVIIDGFCDSDEFRRLCAEYGITPGSVAVGSVNTHVEPEKEIPVVTEEIPEIMQKSDNIECIRTFVAHCYQSALGREGSAEEVDFYTEKIVSGQMSAKQTAAAFIFSPEFQGKGLDNTAYIRILYRLCLGREADAEGLANWMENMAKGETRQSVFNGFTESDEFIRYCSGYDIPSGTTGNYSVEIQDPMNSEESKETEEAPAAPASEYANEEKVREFVIRFYRNALGREPDGEGLAHFVGRILSGAATPKDVAREIILSDEFRGRMPDNEELVRILYRVYLGREADDEGLANWTEQLNSGISLEDVLNGFAGSDEFRIIMNGMR